MSGRGRPDPSPSRQADAVIRAVLFDLGGVLTTGPFEGFARYERQHDLPDGLIKRINSANYDANAWARFERGEVDLDRFCELFEAEARGLGHRVDAREVLEAVRGQPRAEMVEAVRFCRHRFKTAALTNNFVVPDRAGSATEPLASVFAELFDVVIESSKVGVRKPDPRFYQMACRALEVRPSESVFLDDLGVNLKPARAMGMHTIKVVSGAQALTELYGILGVAPDGWDPTRAVRPAQEAEPDPETPGEPTNLGAGC